MNKSLKDRLYLLFLSLLPESLTLAFTSLKIKSLNVFDFPNNIVLELPEDWSFFGVVLIVDLAITFMILIAASGRNKN